MSRLNDNLGYDILGGVLLRLGEDATAVMVSCQALAALEEIGDTVTAAQVQHNLA